jgi:hypothetical protein
MIKMVVRTICHSHCRGHGIRASNIESQLTTTCTCCQLLYIICGILEALLIDRLGDKPVLEGGGECHSLVGDLGHCGL